MKKARRELFSSKSWDLIFGLSLGIMAIVWALYLDSRRRSKDVYHVGSPTPEAVVTNNPAVLMPSHKQ